MRNKDLILRELKRRWFQKNSFRFIGRLTEIKKDAESGNSTSGVKKNVDREKSVVSVPLLGEENNGK